MCCTHAPPSPLQQAAKTSGIRQLPRPVVIASKVQETTAWTGALKRYSTSYIKRSYRLLLNRGPLHIILPHSSSVATH